MWFSAEDKAKRALVAQIVAHLPPGSVRDPEAALMGMSMGGLHKLHAALTLLANGGTGRVSRGTYRDRR